MSGKPLWGFIAAVLAATCLFAGGDRSKTSDVAGADSDVSAQDCRVTFVERRTLSVERPGILSEAVREGGRVSAGEIVLRVQDAVPKSALAVAEARAESDADVRAAAKEHEAAEFEYQTHRKANESRPGTYTDIEMRRVQLAAESAALKVELAEYEREVNRRLRDQAQDELSTYHVPSTISGLVTRAYKGNGEAVQLGEPILEVVNTEHVRIEGFVRLADAWRVKVGMPVSVRVELAGGDGGLAAAGENVESESVVELHGELGFVDVDVQPVSQVVRVWAEIANENDVLRDGLTADMTIHVSGSRPEENETTSSSR